MKTLSYLIVYFMNVGIRRKFLRFFKGVDENALGLSFVRSVLTYGTIDLIFLHFITLDNTGARLL